MKINELANLTSSERQIYFIEAASRMNVSPIIIEKDFWVCWLLKILFEIAELKDNITFKGGTSLSKVYGAIERFSEDIDVVIDKTYLGFSIENLPTIDHSKKSQKKISELILSSCNEVIKNKIYTLLKHQIATILISNDWSLEINEQSEKDVQIDFYYPNSFKSDYIKSIVKLELGARGDTEPGENQIINPYLSQYITSLDKMDVMVRSLDIVRTFWEKVTLIHNCNYHNKIRERYSRHFYDLVMLYRMGIMEKAILRQDILKDVLNNKIIYFDIKSYSHFYEKVQILPSELNMEVLRNDYEKMAEMFFEEPITFDIIISDLKEIEIGMQSLLQSGASGS